MKFSRRRTLLINRSIFPCLIQKWPELRPVSSGIARIGATTLQNKKRYGAGQGGIKSGAARRKLTHDRDKAIVQAVSAGRSLRNVAGEFGLSLKAVLAYCQPSGGCFHELHR